jgi:hypothetical protein
MVGPIVLGKVELKNSKILMYLITVVCKEDYLVRKKHKDAYWLQKKLPPACPSG